MEIKSFSQAKKCLTDLIRQTKSELNYDSSNGYTGINDPLAKSLGIVVEEHVMPFDFGAYLPEDPPARPMPIIWIDSASSDRERINFSFYHEISHHLIRKDNDLYSFLCDIAGQNEDFNNLVDHFANIGAAEFLIPSDEVIALIKTRGFSIKLLPELDQCYPASKPAIAIQMAQCASHRCFVVVCKYGTAPITMNEQSKLFEYGTNQIPKLYVEYASNSPSQNKYSIGKFALIPENHLFYQAYQQQDCLKGNDHIPFRNGNKKWIANCEALFYKGKVYGILNLSKPNVYTDLQPSLF